MADPDIIRLFLERSEQAISECRSLYGECLRKTARRILRDPRDAEEAESDAYFKAWSSIPPERPENLRAYLMRLCRNAALDICRRSTRKKRGGSGYDAAFEELEQLCSSGDTAREATDRVAFSRALNAFLGELPKRKRRIFVQRYWYFMTPEEIAGDNLMTRQAVNTELMRLRKRFAEHLGKEGFLQ